MPCPGRTVRSRLHSLPPQQLEAGRQADRQTLPNPRNPLNHIPPRQEGIERGREELSLPNRREQLEAGRQADNPEPRTKSILFPSSPSSFPLLHPPSPSPSSFPLSILFHPHHSLSSPFSLLILFPPCPAAIPPHHTHLPSQPTEPYPSPTGGYRERERRAVPPQQEGAARGRETGRQTNPP